MSRSLTRTVAFFFAVSAGYYFGARFGLALTPRNHPVSTLWPPNAIVQGILLLVPIARWPLVLLAVLPAHVFVELQSGVPIVMVLCWYVSNCAEGLLAASAIRAVVRDEVIFDRYLGVAAFVACGVLLAPFATSFLDALFVQLNAFGTGGYWDVWRTRLSSNTLANVAIVPAIVTWGHRGLAPFRAATPRRVIEATALGVGLLVTCAAVSMHPGLTGRAMPALLYAPLPFLLWAALRFGPAGTSASLLVFALLAVWGAINGNGPFAGATIAESVVSLQLFLLLTSIVLMTLSAVFREREVAEEALRHEAAIRQSEAHFRELADAAPQIVFTASVDGEIDYINAKWYELTNLPLGPIDDHTWLDVIHPDDADDCLETWRANVAAGRPHEHEARFLSARTGAHRWHLVRALPIRDAVGVIRHWYGTATDIDDHKRAEDAVRRSEAALRQLGEELERRVAERTIELSRANETLRIEIEDRVRVERALRASERQLAHLGRVTVLGELSAALAHEVNQPLTAILANARAAERMLARGDGNLAEVHAILDDIVADDLRAGAVIRRVRALVRKEETDPQPMNVNEVVEEVLDLARSDLMLREVRVRTNLAAPLPLLLGDRVQIQQVLLNLVVNACDAMVDIPEGERIVHITTVREDGGVRLAVSDRGVGLGNEAIELVFEPFVTTKPQGLGLGLAICRSIVRAHGGKIWATNNPDRGATFHLLLTGAIARTYNTPSRSRAAFPI